MSIQKDIPELLRRGIITPETAEEIRLYYKSKGGSSANRLFLAFGILGALLIGLGIILIIAHNWDDLSRPIKSFFAFLPLLLTQGICFYVLLRKSQDKVWIESATTALIFAIGACISLISQVYNIQGDLDSFLLLWAVLSLPLIYVMRSSMAALLYILGITYYAMESGYFSYLNSSPNYYWLLLLAVLPQYYLLYKNQPRSNFLILENWLVSLSITIVLGTVPSTTDSLLYVAYFSLFGLFYLIGQNSNFNQKGLRDNPYKVIGTLGILILLFVSSFEGFWSGLRRENLFWENLVYATDFWVSLAITLLGLFYFLQQKKDEKWGGLSPFTPIFLLFIPIFILGYFSTFSVILVNIIILGLSIFIIVEGAKKEHLGILNFGLSIITLWIIIRFINTDLNFVLRGLILMAIGLGFFIANYLMLKKRKRNG